MGRPTATDGGRPILVGVRLSVKEAERLDAKRGSASRQDFFRAALNDRVLPRERAAAPAKVHDIPEPAFKDPEDAWGGQAQAPPPDFDPQAPVRDHYHVRGQKIGQAAKAGAMVPIYGCKTPGCGWTSE